MLVSDDNACKGGDVIVMHLKSVIIKICKLRQQFTDTTADMLSSELNLMMAYLARFINCGLMIPLERPYYGEN